MKRKNNINNNNISLIDSIYVQADSALKENNNIGVDFLLHTIEQDVETVAQLAFKNTCFTWAFEDNKASLQITPANATLSVGKKKNIQQLASSIESEIRTRLFEGTLDTKKRQFVTQYLKLHWPNKKLNHVLPIEIRKLIGSLADFNTMDGINILLGMFAKNETDDFRKHLISMPKHPYVGLFFNHLNRCESHEVEWYLNKHGDAHRNLTFCPFVTPKFLPELGKRFPKIESLLMNCTQFDDATLASLNKCKAIKSLTLHGTQKAGSYLKFDINHLKDLSKLEILALYELEIHNINALKNSPLKSLTLTDCTILDLDFLEHHQALEEINLNGLSIQNLNGLAKQKNLKACRLSNLQQITSIAPIENCKNITQLSISNLKQLQTIDPILNLNNLTSFSYNFDKSTDTSSLQKIETRVIDRLGRTKNSKMECIIS